MGEADELTGDKKKILEKLMDQDEEEPEVCTVIYMIITEFLFFLCHVYSKLILEAFI